MEPQVVLVPDFLALTLALVVYLVGADMTRRFEFLRDYNIPEPVAGGLLASVLIALIHAAFDLRVEFELETRDALLVTFFAGIGLNARVSDLLNGGKPLAILLALTVGFIVVQNAVGVAGAALFGLPSGAGVLLGSASLIGGHGTAIAWAPEIAATQELAGAMELGVAAATLGLIAAAVIGGPVAAFLIERRNLTPDRPTEELTVGIAHDEADQEPITHVAIMRALLAVNVSIALGWAASEAIAGTGFTLPLFVPCLIMGVVIGNLLTALFPRMVPVSRSPALGLISDYALSVFLAMSLMSLQLSTLTGLGAALLFVLAVQTALTVGFVVFALFPAMGGGYRAAVLSAGFAGFSMGATPTAIANMTAVTKRYGPSPMAFIILPLVSAFFVDLANAFVIRLFLAL